MGDPHPSAMPPATRRESIRILSKTKFALAISNRANPTMQTHPEREYIAGRWTDALASGATVVGIPLGVSLYSRSCGQKHCSV
jgi:hypothetical protein